MEMAYMLHDLDLTDDELAADMCANLARLKGVPAGLIAHAKELTAGVDVDLDGPPPVDFQVGD